MSDRYVELTTRDGGRLRITSLLDQSPLRFRVRLHNPYRGEHWEEEIRSEDAASIVEFLGYPVEVPPEREKLDEALRLLAEKCDRVMTLEGEVQTYRADLVGLRADLAAFGKAAGVLVEALKGAWWLDASRAYHLLDDWLETHFNRRLQ